MTTPVDRTSDIISTMIFNEAITIDTDTLSSVIDARAPNELLGINFTYFGQVIAAGSYLPTFEQSDNGTDWEAIPSASLILTPNDITSLDNSELGPFRVGVHSISNFLRVSVASTGVGPGVNNIMILADQLKTILPPVVAV